MRLLLFRLVFPFYMIITHFLHISPEPFQRLFIDANNRSVKRLGKKYRPEKILVLLPHCLQKSDCNIRIIFHPENCRKCGRCDISAILDLKERFGFHLAIATGGTLARKIVREIRPDFIIATACEQDLSLGIYDVRKIPVYGILNQRPEGPCINTCVDTERMEKVLGQFTKREEK